MGSAKKPSDDKQQPSAPPLTRPNRETEQPPELAPQVTLKDNTFSLLVWAIVFLILIALLVIDFLTGLRK